MMNMWINVNNLQCKYKKLNKKMYNVLHFDILCHHCVYGLPQTNIWFKVGQIIIITIIITIIFHQ